MLRLHPVTLEGTLVRLEPLTPEHAESMFESACFPEIWTYMHDRLLTREAVDMYIAVALAAQEQGAALPFAIVEQSSGKVIGSTRLGNIAHRDRGVEIGWTWLTPRVWKTPINTECKWLLLRHCFEVLGCIRVQLKTDSRNHNSQRAIARLGAVREGVLRNHMIMPDGYVRDSVFFSFIDKEWPEVDQRLRTLLGDLA